MDGRHWISGIEGPKKRMVEVRPGGQGWRGSMFLVRGLCENFLRGFREKRGVRSLTRPSGPGGFEVLAGVRVLRSLFRQVVSGLVAIEQGLDGRVHLEEQFEEGVLVRVVVDHESSPSWDSPSWDWTAVATTRR